MDKKSKNKNKNKNKRVTKVKETRVIRNRIAYNVPSQVRPNVLQQKTFNQYVNTLNNPFDHGPVRMGWGSMTNTELATVYVRGTAAIGNSHLSIQAYPCVGSGVASTWSYSTSPSANAWSVAQTSIVPNNQVGLASQFREARVVSGGIRVKSLSPMTSIEPFLYAGFNNGGPITDVQSSIMTALWGSMNSQAYYSGLRDGVQIVTRPLDVDSFKFENGVISTTAAALMEHPWVSVIGANGDIVAYEILYHLEALTGMTASVGDPAIEAPTFLNTLASLFASPEHLLASVRNMLEPAISDANVRSSVGHRFSIGNQREAFGGGYLIA